MARFQVRQRERMLSGHPRYLVVDTEDRDRPIAEFDDEEAAHAHAERVNAGPFDWDEQEAWQDEWEDDWGEDAAPGADGGGGAQTG